MSHRRKLAAILSADVVGYSRLMGDDEQATLSTLTAYRDIFGQHIAAHEGRVIDSPGDALLAEFPSAIEAVNCAVEIQRELAGRSASLPEHRRMRFRIGINLGDVTEQDGALYGDGVNIAARLESLAEAGGICVSGSVYDQVEGKLPVAFKFAGEQSVKNIAKPIRAYRPLLDLGESHTGGPSSLRWKRPIALITSLALMAVIVALVAWYARPPPSPSKEDAVLAMPRGPTIAVLPFTNLGGDPSEDYFSDGLTEDIITELARFKELHVLARNTTFQFKNKSVDVPAIGRKLGAHYVLEGSVRRSGDRVRMSAQLIDTSSGAHIWADKYDRSLNDIFAVQDEIAGGIAAKIAGGSGGVLIRAEQEHAASKHASQLDAYDHILRAITSVPGAPEDKETIDRKLEHLRQAIALDPGYARPRAEYAYRRILLWAFLLDRSVPLEEITRDAEAAVRLDPSDPLAHRTAAFAQFFSKRLDLFNGEAKAALDLAPNNAELLAQLGALYTFSGHWESGVGLVTKAQTLSPISAAGWYHSALHYDFFRKQQYQQALDIMTMHPGQNQLETEWKYVAAYGALGNNAKALEHWKKCLEFDSSWSKAKLGDRLRMWNFPETFIRSYVDTHGKAGIAD